MTSTSGSWHEQDRHTKHFLDSFTIADIVPGDQRLTSINEDATIEEAIKRMNKHNVLSLPVWHAGRKEFIGMVNIYDIVSAICFRTAFKLGDDALRHLSEQEWAKIENAEVFSHPVSSCLGISEEGKNFEVLKSTDNLTKAIHIFGLGIHRVLVHFVGVSALSQDFETQGYYRVLSQTDVLRFLHVNCSTPEVFPLMRRSLIESGMIASSAPSKLSAAVVTVQETATALTAFREMSFRKVSAVAIVDKHNKLLSTLSTSDLRGMTQATFRNLLLPVLDFLKVTRGVHKDLVFCTGEDTIGATIEKALYGCVHRVWVVNNAENRQPLGAISLTDLICLFHT